MNYLAHLLLAGDDHQAQLGALLGDFTRGRLETLARRYPPGVMHGIDAHRRIDRFTDLHARVMCSKRRFSSTHTRFAGIIVDVLHDHFLSQHWSRFTTVDREAFIAHCYALINDHHSLLPERLRRVAPLLVEQDWLGSYLQLGGIDQVYQRLSRRISRSNPLAGAIDEVNRHYGALEADFLIFFPDLQSYALQLNGIPEYPRSL